VPLLIRRALLGILTFSSALVFVAPSNAAAPQAGRVPVPDGRYGSVIAAQGQQSDCPAGARACFGPQALVMFNVRSRQIVNPRVMIIVTCRNVDGTVQEVMFGPSSNNPDRTSPIPRSGNGRVSWIEDFDSSLIRDATVTLSYTFRRNRSALASVDVRSADAEVTCEGFQNFRLGDASGIPSSIFEPTTP
jgi:hypothetical protein